MSPCTINVVISNEFVLKPYPETHFISLETDNNYCYASKAESNERQAVLL